MICGICHNRNDDRHKRYHDKTGHYFYINSSVCSLFVYEEKANRCKYEIGIIPMESRQNTVNDETVA